jgi:hypothetical protein
MVDVIAAEPIDDRAREALETIVSRAFGIEGGYLELNGVVDGAAGFDMFQKLGLYQHPMDIVVHQLRQQLEADGRGEPCLRALLVHMPGNFELRDWLARHCPTMLAAVSQAAFEGARAAYEKDRMARRVRSIEINLNQLGGSVVLEKEQRDLGLLMISKLDELTDYKSIHDVLHGLQMGTLAELTRVSNAQILAIERQLSLGAQYQELVLAVERARRQFSEAGASVTAVILRDAVVVAIERIIKFLGGADRERTETSEAAAGMLRAMLRQQMSLFDSKLVEASDEIPFKAFANLMRDLPQPLVAPTNVDASADPILLSNVGNSFEHIENRLIRRRTVHARWQEVEATLLNIEELLRGTGREIELRLHWERLAELIAELAILSAEHDLFVLPLPVAASDSDADFAAAVRSEDYLRIFGFFSREARVRFQRADNALIDDCERLKALHQPLRAMLGE